MKSQGHVVELPTSSVAARSGIPSNANLLLDIAQVTRGNRKSLSMQGDSISVTISSWSMPYHPLPELTAGVCMKILTCSQVFQISVSFVHKLSLTLHKFSLTSALGNSICLYLCAQIHRLRLQYILACQFCLKRVCGIWPAAKGKTSLYKMNQLRS